MEKNIISIPKILYFQPKAKKFLQFSRHNYLYKIFSKKASIFSAYIWKKSLKSFFMSGSENGPWRSRCFWPMGGVNPSMCPAMLPIGLEAPVSSSCPKSSQAKHWSKVGWLKIRFRSIQKRYVLSRYKLIASYSGHTWVWLSISISRIFIAVMSSKHVAQEKIIGWNQFLFY